MSSSNRHSRNRRRSYERSNYGSGGQDSRYTNTPPRFANRRPNGDGLRDNWDNKNGYHSRRETGGPRQGSSGNYGEFRYFFFSECI